MKLFVASDIPKKHISCDMYNECFKDELLRFDIYQFIEPCQNSTFNSLVGITSFGRTTDIEVADIRIEKDYFMELLIDSILSEYNNISYSSNRIKVIKATEKFTTETEFDIIDMAEMLISKASFFKAGDSLKVRGKNFRKV